MSRFMKSFLEERSFRVAIGNTFSGIRILENGVPQGTIIAVTSFLIRMTEVEPFIPRGVQIRMYADDILITAAHDNCVHLRNKMKKAVFGVEAWTTINGFRLAADKSCLVHICNKYKHVEREQIMMDTGPIMEAGSCRVLGVYFDCRFNFRRHSVKAKESVELWNRILKTIGGRKIGAARETLIYVHQAAVQAKMFFGWGIASNASAAIMKEYEGTYNAGIRQASGVFKSSPTLAVMAEAGTLPFGYAQTNALVQAALRVQSKSKEERAIFIRAKTKFESITGMELPQIAEVERVSERGWNEPVPKIDWRMKDAVRAGDPRGKVSAVFNELLQQYRDYEQIYTDGSLTNHHVGAGISTTERGLAIRLPDVCSIFSAEAFAIKEAIKEFAEEETSTVIFSDSASVLAAIEGGHSTHPLIQQIEIIMKEKNVTLCWVPGHVGIAGNEEADKLASYASNIEISKIPVPARDVRKWSKTQIIVAWEKEWRDERNLFLRRIKSSVIPGVDQAVQADQRALTRLRIGHTRITHEGIFSKTRTQCDACKVNLTVEHLLIECPKYEQQRRTAGITGSIDRILNNERDQEKKLLKFLRITNLYHKI